MNNIKLFPNQCPKCGEPALEFPLETEYLLNTWSYSRELLQCSKCDYQWNEFYEKRYLGYEDDNGMHPQGT